MPWYIAIAICLIALWAITLILRIVSDIIITRRWDRRHEAFRRQIAERDSLREQLAASEALVQKLFVVKEVDRTRPCGAPFRTGTWGILRCRKPLGHNLDHRTISPAGDALQFNDYMVDRRI